MRVGIAVLYALVSTAYATNTQQCKSDDKCIRALHESCKSATAKTFCASYLHTKAPPTATKGLPSWLDGCGPKDKVSRISSACSCYLTTSSKFSTSTRTTTSSPRPTTSTKSSSKYPTSSRTSKSTTSTIKSSSTKTSSTKTSSTKTSSTKTSSTKTLSSTTSLTRSPSPTSSTSSRSGTTCPTAITSITVTTFATVTYVSTCPTQSTVTITQPASTVTEPGTGTTLSGSIVTETGPTVTITQPGGTVTEPGTGTTLPGSTVTETGPPVTITQPGGTVTEPGTCTTVSTTLSGSTITEPGPTVTITQPGSTVTEPASTTTVTQPGSTTTVIGPKSSSCAQLLQNGDFENPARDPFPWISAASDSQVVSGLVDQWSPGETVAYYIEMTAGGSILQISQGMTFCGGIYELSLRLHGAGGTTWTVSAFFDTVGSSAGPYQMSMTVPSDQPMQRRTFPTRWQFPTLADGVGRLRLQFTPLTASTASPAELYVDDITLSRV